MAGLAVAVTFAIAAAGIATAMTVARLQSSFAPLYSTLCNVKGTFFGLPFDCDQVNSSLYGTLFGIPLSTLGVAFYLVLLILAGISVRGREPAAGKAANLLLGGATLALAFSVPLLLVQILQLRVLCPLCLMLYGAHLGLLLGAWCAVEVGFAAGIRGLLRLLRRPHREILLWVSAGVFALIVVGVQTASSMVGAARNPRLVVLEESLSRAVRFQLEPAPDDAATGPRDAAYLIVEFSDFMCPFCQQAAIEARSLKNDMPGRVRLVFKHFPLDTTCNPYIDRNLHPGACDAAAAAVCAQRAGKFWVFHDALFARQDEIFEGNVRANLVSEAVRLGLSGPRFAACLDDPETLARVRADIEEARAIQVPGTPAFLVNGRAFFTGPLQLGAASLRVVRLAIAANLLLD
jgi:protein-disulfide isomerase/uncharacterized membrane protein